MTEQATVRRGAIYLVIGAFTVAALMGIVALLGGGTFGDGEARVLMTTLIVGCASLFTLCYLSTGDTQWASVGAIGMAVLVVPLTTSLLLVWTHAGSDGVLLKIFGIGLVCATTLAHVCLMLGLATRRNAVNGILYATIALALLLALLIIGLILDAVSGETVGRPLGVVAILDALGTVVTIALARFGVTERGAAPSTRLQVRLSSSQSDALARLAATTGREPASLVAEAVDRYLAR